MAEKTTAEIAETGSTEAGTISLAANIVVAYVSNNSLPATELASLLLSVHHAVAGLASGVSTVAEKSEEIEKPTAAQVRKSITPDAIISFIDGKAYKTMKRHLGTHGLDPHSYRQRYGLPSDYPMVAPNYAAQRSTLAKSIGLGRPGSMAAAEAAQEPEVSAAPTRKPRARKAA